MNLLKDAQISYGLSAEETNKTIYSLNEINKLRNNDEASNGTEEDDDDDEEMDENDSIVFSSDSNDSNFLIHQNYQV